MILYIGSVHFRSNLIEKVKLILVRLDSDFKKRSPHSEIIPLIYFYFKFNFLISNREYQTNILTVILFHLKIIRSKRQAKNGKGSVISSDALLYKNTNFSFMHILQIKRFFSLTVYNFSEFSQIISFFR